MVSHAGAHVPRWMSCAIVGLTLIAGTSANGQAPAPDLDVTDRVVTASRIYALIQQYFEHRDGVPQLEIEAAYREYAGQAVRAQTRRAFDLATLRFIATLRNGHTQFFDSQLDGRPLKFRLLEVEDQWVVIDSQDSRLPRGAVVRSLNGSPVGDVVRELSQYVAASNDRLARAHVFSYAGLFPERVPVVLQDGRVIVVDRGLPGDTRQPSPTRESDGRWLRENRVAYIRIPSFGDSAYERTAAELVHRFSSAPGLVVDVRGNGGGATPLQLIAALMNRPRPWWQESTPQHIALLEAQGVPPFRTSRDFLPLPPSNDAYAGRLVLLVDRFCGSACEDFVMPFKSTGRATVVGETTQGSSGNPYRTDLGSGMSVAVGAVRYRFPDGSPFEGIGIEPDVSVERRLADVVSNRDVVLARGEELAGASK
jgi:carboxyl-terminal processing protease